MFSQDPPVWREASRNRFYDDFELDFGRILEAKLAHISPFGRPGAKRMHVFWKSANELDFSVRSDVEESRNGGRCW